jgi:hypothetical protein
MPVESKAVAVAPDQVVSLPRKNILRKGQPLRMLAAATGYSHSCLIRSEDMSALNCFHQIRKIIGR